MKRYKKKRQRDNLRPTLATIAVLIFFGMMVAFLLQRKQKPLIAKEVEEAIGIPYRIETLPESNKRPIIKRKIKYIVVHNTANPESTARNERDYLSNPTNEASTSWHIAVDDKEMIEAIPVTEVAFHAGAEEGNAYGIGIEICESGNYEKAEDHAKKLIAYLLKTYQLPLESVKTHKDFTGKDCPRVILEHWDSFINEVSEIEKQMK